MVKSRAVPRALRASSTARLEPPSLRTHGRQASRLFSVLAPRWWNELPLGVRLAVFKRRLKTHLFVKHLSTSTDPLFGQCLSSWRSGLVVSDGVVGTEVKQSALAANTATPFFMLHDEDNTAPLIRLKASLPQSPHYDCAQTTNTPELLPTAADSPVMRICRSRSLQQCMSCSRSCGLHSTDCCPF
ncbi:hypothetical protein NFI96_032207 [Prochilodus magdalenae]|nr:hypothetical protein NFI96_032207 [Prochilodus magdalenae]